MLLNSDWINAYILKLLICEVNTILGFNTRFNVVTPKDGREIWPRKYMFIKIFFGWYKVTCKVLYSLIKYLMKNDKYK